MTSRLSKHPLKKVLLRVAAAFCILFPGTTIIHAQTLPPAQSTAAVIDSPEIIEARKVLKHRLERNPGIKKVIFHFGGPGEIPSVEYYDPFEHAQSFIVLGTILTDTIAATYSPGSPVMHDGWKVSYIEYVQMHESYWLSSKWSESDAKEVVRALKILVSDAHRLVNANMEVGFQGMIKFCSGWPAVKLPMPEDARSHKVKAEAAYRNKDFDTAATEYVAALNIYPCWPEGQFNTAYIEGDTGWYPVAIYRMKRYIWLAPDAPDVQAAKDQIVAWEAKLGH